MKNIHNWVNTALIVVVGVLVLVGGNNQPVPQEVPQDLGATGTRFPNGISTDSTSPTVGQVRAATLLSVGTTTLNQSVDGLVIGGGISTAATGTVITVHTNTTGPKLCDSSTGYLYVKNNGSFAPSLIWSMGTSTSAAAATNLVASTTVATTTSTIIAPLARLFEYLQGDSLTVIFDDITNVSASTTNLSDWSAEAGIWCQDLSLSI